DIIVSNGSGGVRVLLGDGSGSFTQSQFIAESNNGSSVILGDVDGDNDLDLLVDGTLFLNNGSGSFSQSQVLSETINGFNVTDAAFADLDGDGDLDAYLTNFCGSQIWLNDGNGTFVFDHSGASAYRLAVGDVDGDGNADDGATEDEFFTISAAQLLANDSDVDASDTLTVIGVGQTTLIDTQGSVTLVGDQVIYDPT
ncbi:MAG: VCBS repeat-containing protein, partial [Planctomycetes bacterium]|nr:VCBS repeat-containing protein [Planctomycetota bacterium]